jgi:hypothetical protein
MNEVLFNCILDGFPQSYKGYLLNTDFKVGILLTLLLEDEDIPDDLKYLQAFDLLYKDKVPDDMELAVEGLIWFISCGKSELFYADGYKEDKCSEKCIDFTQDHLDIWGAFWARGIDLTVTNMHWFKFMSAIGNLGDCPLSTKIGYRATELKDMKGETRAYYAKLKEKYRVRKIVTREELSSIISNAEKKHGSYYAKLLKAQQQ